jgi:lauroyl/myristoyl acyltransferase
MQAFCPLEEAAKHMARILLLRPKPGGLASVGSAPATALRSKRAMAKVNGPAQEGRSGRRRGPSRRFRAQASESVRIVAFLVLRCASYLPRTWAFRAADWVGSIYAASPVGRRLRKEMANSFPDGDAAKIASEWITRPFRDYVHTVRIVRLKDHPPESHVEFHNAPSELKTPGQSVIIAAGHFSREAMSGLYLRNLLPKPMATAVASLDPSMDLRAVRLRIQLGEMVRGIECLREGDVDVVFVGRGGTLSRLVRDLKKPGALIVLGSDSIVTGGRDGGLDRPFAGHASVSFALGTARLARMAQCPVVTCVPFLDTDGRIVVEWGELIPAPARDDEAADIRITNAILDVFERAVGQRPGQYVLPIGTGRRWDAGAQCWRGPGEATAAPEKHTLAVD